MKLTLERTTKAKEDAERWRRKAELYRQQAKRILLEARGDADNYIKEAKRLEAKAAANG